MAGRRTFPLAAALAACLASTAAARQVPREPAPSAEPSKPTPSQLEVFGGLGIGSLSLIPDMDLGSGTSVDVGIRYGASRRWRVCLRLTTTGNYETWRESQAGGTSWSIKDPRTDRWLTPAWVRGRTTLIMAEGSVHSRRKTVAPYAFLGAGLARVSQSFEPLDQGTALRLDDTLGALSMGAGASVSLWSGRLDISPELRIIFIDHSDEVSGYFGAQGVILASYRF